MKYDYNDFLDSKAKSANFLNDNKYSKEYKTLADFWSKLPLYENKDEIKKFIKNFDENQIILIRSGTGSGKTVLIPKFVLKHLTTKSQDNKLIAVTNPKILTTEDNANFSAKTLDVEIGKQVGYRYRGSSEKAFSSETKLVYCTDGILLSQISSGDILLKEYDVVIIDEVHERPVPIDLLIYYIRNIFDKRPNFKLILMSATVDSKIFKKYFSELKYVEQTISGKTYYPITSHWTNDFISDRNYLDKGIEKILKILETTKSGDILFFVSTAGEALNGCKKLKELCSNKYKAKGSVCDNYYCIEVYSKMTPARKELALSPTSTTNRKVLISTNLAESSITFPGIVYIVESGYEWTVYSDSYKWAAVMNKRFITKAQIDQRMGRAGRTQPGECYHLYSESKYKQISSYPDPNILTNDITDYLIGFIKYQKTLINTIDLIEGLLTVPHFKQINGSLYFLHFYNIVKMIYSKDDETSSTKSQDSDTPRTPIMKGGYRVIEKIFADQNNGMCMIGGYSESDSDLYDGVESSKDNSSEDILFRDKQVDTSPFSNDYTSIIIDENTSESTEDPIDDIGSDDEAIIDDKLGVTDIDYLALNSYNDLRKYNGTLTRFGYMMARLSGHPLILMIMILYGILLDIKNIIIDLVSVLIVYDNKLDNLFTDLITANKIIESNNLAYEGSDQLTLYQVYTDYYLLGNIDGLHLDNFKKIDELKEQFLKTTNRFTKETLLKTNEKYKLISNQILDTSDLGLINKILICIILSHKINLAHLSEEKTVKYNNVTKINRIYKNKYPLEQSLGQISFSITSVEPKTSFIKQPLVYYSNVIIGNRSMFNSITIVPEDLKWIL